MGLSVLNVTTRPPKIKLKITTEHAREQHTMNQDRIHWRSLDELTNHPDFVKNAGNEFNPPALGDSEGSVSDEPGRRDFLKLMGFGVAAATLAACDAPVKKAIPFLAKPENYDPSIPNWYASTYMEDGDYCAILVKTREGRPIKIEGNKLSSITRGGTSVRVQSSVLSLYDNTRFEEPQIDGKKATWEELDKQVSGAMAAATAAGKGLRLVMGTNPSPSFKVLLAQLSAKYPTLKVVTYDAVPYSGISRANYQAFGKAVVPSYDFSRAETIVTFGADFLGTWVSPIEFAKQFAKRRRLGKESKSMSRMYAFEPTMSLTGANADERTIVKASGLGIYVSALYSEVMAKTGQAGTSVSTPDNGKLAKIATELVANRGRSLVVSGSNDPQVQLIVNAINFALANYGSTINLDVPNNTKGAGEEEFQNMLGEVAAGSVAAVMFLGVNPVYTHPNGKGLKDVLKNTFTLSFAEKADETSAICKYVAPNNHFLESWGDCEPKPGFYSLVQPTITPIFNTRQAAESLMAWAGMGNTYYDLIKSVWKGSIYPTQTLYSSFNQFWNYALHDGIYEVGRPSLRGRNFLTSTGETAYQYMNTLGVAPAAFNANMAAAQAGLGNSYMLGNNELELIVYEKVGMGTGSQANNPWLQEFPDPISRVTWENYLTVSPAKAKELGITLVEGKASLVKLNVAGKEYELPAVIQPGQEKNTVAIALGYGRAVAGPSAKDKGLNAFPFLSFANGSLTNIVGKVAVSKGSSDEYMLGHVQTSHTYAGRPVVQESVLKEYQKDPKAGREFASVTTPEGKVKPTDISLWNSEVNKRPNHAWGMMIDLNTCIGCGACVAGCNVENNVPVVGKQEVVNRREMHWIRIDRYYSSVRTGKEATTDELETAAENPEVVFQPMMCQHCNNAPCETVCPVLATTHSTEGLNQMTYNRCIGTRYCANNCPYKVRRFNWFSYPQNKKNFPLNPANDALGRMVLNPDVTVRARGVMEKCSMCIQRIQDGKLNAKKEGRRPVDGEINTACAAACPTDAIVFGDMNDPESRITATIKEQYSERAFHVLEEINTKPSVGYLTKIRNKA